MTKLCHENVLSFFRKVPEVLSLGLTLSWVCVGGVRLAGMFVTLTVDPLVIFRLSF